mgnify:FL=1
MNQHNHRTSDSSTDTLIIVGAIIFVTVGFFWGAWHYGSVAIEPYRVCRRVNILRDYPDDKIKIYP